MLRLFNYRTDSKDNIFQTKIYADSLENSLMKWIELMNHPDTVGHFNAELKSMVNQVRVSPFKKLQGSGNTYYTVFPSIQGHLTIYVDDVDIQPDFIADLKYLATEKGGRLEYATSGYRPHIRFPFSQSMTTGEQVFWEKDKVYPGEKIRAQIRILNHVTFRYALSIGTTFEFCEGSRIIGTGKIVEVVDEALKKASR